MPQNLYLFAIGTADICHFTHFVG